MNWPEIDYRRLMANRREKSEKPNNPRPIIPKPVMNKTEVRYVDEVLTPELYAKEILAWKYEAVKFRIAKKTYYTPDFMVIHPQFIEFVEIKGFLRDDAGVKFKACRELYPWFEWDMLRLVKGIWVPVNI